jgi:hypothetical protein
MASGLKNPTLYDVLFEISAQNSNKSARPAKQNALTHNVQGTRSYHVKIGKFTCRINADPAAEHHAGEYKNSSYRIGEY